MRNVTEIIIKCKRIFEIKIITGSDVKVVYSIIAIGKNEYNNNTKLAIASRFWYIRILSLMKYSYLANICKTKYNERQNTKKFNKISSGIIGIKPKAIETNIEIAFNKTTNLLYFLGQSSDFCS